MDDLRFRLGSRDDVDAIAALTCEAYAKWIPVTGRKPMPMRADYAALIDVHRFDLAFAGRTLAGLIQTVPHGSELMIENVAVHPAFQRRGLGHRLLALAETMAVTAGLSGTRLYTNALMVENIGLYHALGYRVERRVAMEDAVAVHMVKTGRNGEKAGR